MPVFRYALERWDADVYEVVVFHQGEFSNDEASVVEWLESSSITQNGFANYSVNVIDLDEAIPASHRRVWDRLDSLELPHLAVLYPKSFYIRQIVWDGRFTLDNAKKIVDSPARQKIADSILSEDSAVWIFLESGDETKDKAAFERLSNNLVTIGDSLTKCCNEIFSLSDASEEPASALQNISFSIIRISQNDPGEAFLINKLLRSEPELVHYRSYPMTFPVFGRGRVLYALVGDGINEQNISRACTFLTGPCSCEIKELNPGFDLLMTVDWESRVQYQYAEETGLPLLTGLTEIALIEDSSFSEDINNGQEAPIQTSDENDSLSLMNTFGNSLITVGILILVVIMLRMLLISRKKR